MNFYERYQTRRILKTAKKRIANPRHWSQWHYAVNDKGCSVNPSDTSAVKWCAMGSYLSSARKLDSPPELVMAGSSALYKAAHDMTGYSTTYVNDQLGHKAVMKMFDRAVENVQTM